MFSEDPVVRRIAAFCDRAIVVSDFERTLNAYRRPRPTKTLQPWLEKEIAAALPGMTLTDAYVTLLDEPGRLDLAGGMKHFRHILRGEVAPHPSTIFWIGERLRTASALRIESSSGLAAALASGRFFDAFGAAGVLHRATGFVWPALSFLPRGPTREALAIPKQLQTRLPEVWNTWLATRRSPHALRPWRALVETATDVPIDGLLRLIESWPDVDFVRC